MVRIQLSELTHAFNRLGLAIEDSTDAVNFFNYVVYREKYKTSRKKKFRCLQTRRYYNSARKCLKGIESIKKRKAERQYIATEGDVGCKGCCFLDGKNCKAPYRLFLNCCEHLERTNYTKVLIYRKAIK